MRFVLAIIYRNLVVSRRSALRTLMRVILQPAIYLFVFGFVVGSMIPAAGNHGYAGVMAPGIVAMATIGAPFTTIGNHVLSGFYFRTLEEWLLAPASLRTVMAAMVVSGMCSGVGSSVVVVALAWLILGLVPQSLASVLLVVSLGSLLFSLLALIVLLLPERPDRGQEILSFLMMPMTFFGCTFYSYAMLEPPFSYLALLLPTTYISEGLRATYAPETSHMDPGFVLAGLALVLIVLLPLADWSFRRRLGHFLW